MAEQTQNPVLRFFRDTGVQRRLCIFLFMLIPMVLLAVFTYIPFFKMIQFSFYNRNYLSEGTYVGLENYREVFSRKDTMREAKNSARNS